MLKEKKNVKEKRNLWPIIDYRAYLIDDFLSQSHFAATTTPIDFFLFIIFSEFHI